MTQKQLEGVNVVAAANVYFDGKCVSHALTLADGTRKSVGVVLPSQLTFGTAAPEIMECVAGGCRVKLPGSGAVFISLKESDKAMMVPAAKMLVEMGYTVLATDGTAAHFEAAGVAVTRVKKVSAGRPHIVDAIKNGEVQLIFNTTEGRQSHKDSYSIRRTALELKIPCYTTASAAEAAVKSLKKIDAGALEPRSLQSYSRVD